jgi:hypothetical protein
VSLQIGQMLFLLDLLLLCEPCEPWTSHLHFLGSLAAHSGFRGVALVTELVYFALRAHPVSDMQGKLNLGKQRLSRLPQHLEVAMIVDPCQDLGLYKHIKSIPYLKLTYDVQQHAWS